MNTPPDVTTANTQAIPGLEALAGEALQADNLNAPPEAQELPGEPAPAPVDRMAEAGVLIALFKPMLKMAFPVIVDAPDGEFDALQQPVADCLTFYDVDVSKHLGHPLAALAFAALPLVMRGIENLQKQKKEEKPEPQQLAAKTEETPAPSHDVVTLPRG